jgi:nucleoside-diphosphate-sugar epimerase
VSKAAAELLVSGYQRCFGLESVILRPASIYGPRRTTASLPSYLVANALDRLPSRMTGANDAFDLIYVADVARAVGCAVDSSIAVGRTYTIGTGVPTTNGAIAAMVQRLLPGSVIEIEDVPAESSGEGRFCVDAAARDLEFRSEWTLEAGMRALVDALSARPDLRANARSAYSAG